MTGNEAALANATAIEMYGNVMRSKGLHARAKWAYAEAKKIRDSLFVDVAPIAKAA